MLCHGPLLDPATFDSTPSPDRQSPVHVALVVFVVVVVVVVVSIPSTVRHCGDNETTSPETRARNHWLASKATCAYLTLPYKPVLAGVHLREPRPLAKRPASAEASTDPASPRPAPVPHRLPRKGDSVSVRKPCPGPPSWALRSEIQLSPAPYFRASSLKHRRRLLLLPEMLGSRKRDPTRRSDGNGHGQ